MTDKITETDTALDRVAAVRETLSKARWTRPERIPGLLSFAGREDYLGWVVAWKAVHAGVVAEIRIARARRRDPARTDDERSWAQGQRESLRADSRILQALRLAGKDLARQAREARRAEAA